VNAGPDFTIGCVSETSASAFEIVPPTQTIAALSDTPAVSSTVPVALPAELVITGAWFADGARKM